MDLCSQNWSTELCKIFSCCDMRTTFANREICDIGNLQTVLLEKEIYNWDVARHNKDKLMTYNMYKWECEEYVSTPLPKNVGDTSSSKAGAPCAIFYVYCQRH